MKYISLDLETTGLNSNNCHILQIGMIATDTTDLTTPVEDLPSLNIIVKYDQIIGEPYGLSMNARLLEIMSKTNITSTVENKFKNKFGQYVCKPEDVHDLIIEFLANNGYGPDKNGKYRITVAGKNVGSFDVQFLNNLLEMHNPDDCELMIKHKAIELGSLMFKPESDDHIPSLPECLSRAGLSREVLHDAVEDARDVIYCIRHVTKERQ